jgi:hypothetical protein
MVTDAPVVPDVGDRLLMLGAGVTVKLKPALDGADCPPSDPVTITGPLVAPVGTVAVMLVGVQLLKLEMRVPLKVTEP